MTKEIYMVPILIFKYFFIGLKVVFVDSVKKFFAYINGEVDEIKYDTNQEMSENLINYRKVKNLKKKKEKKYTYSARTLKKLEEEKKLFLEDLQKSGATRLSKPVIYYFKVRDKDGKITTGTINGLSKLDVNAFLLNEEYDVYNIKTSKWINFAYQESSFIGASKMDSKELMFFLTQLSTYIKAGLTLTNSMQILSKQMSKNKAKARVFQAISFELSLGENFSTALERQGTLFPALLINMMKAAEASGNLTETLDDLVDYYTDVEATKKQMKSAIMYPVVILSFSVIVITFVLMYVIPEFTAIYASNDQEITGLTAVVLGASDFIKANIVNMVVVLILVIATIMFLYKRVKAARTLIQVILMKTYVIKDVIIYNEMTIFSKTFASLLRNNVYITDSVEILSKITNNEVYKSILFQTVDNIVRGEKISDAFENHWAVPDVAYYMIVTGESTGELANMMQKISDYYQQMHKSTVTNLKTLIEPILISFLAIIVGLIIISVIVPMYGSMENITGH